MTEPTDQDQSDYLAAVAQGLLAANRAELERAAGSRRFAFATMKWLFLVVFLIALGSMIAAIRTAVSIPDTGLEWSRAGVVAALGGASVVLFAVLLYMRPLAALERNAVIDAYLTVVISSYWARMLDASKADDPTAHIDAATTDAANQLGTLIDRQLLGVSRYMDLIRRAQDEDGQDPNEYMSPL